MSEYPESALREPDDVQRPLTTREMELEIQLTRAEAEAERVKAEAERTKIAAVGEALKQFVEQPGPKAALEGLGAMLHAQAQIAVNQEQHAHEQQMQDKRDAEAQRQREWKRSMRDQVLGLCFLVALVVGAIMLGVLYANGKVDKAGASVAGAFFFAVLQGLFVLAKRR